MRQSHEPKRPLVKTASVMRGLAIAIVVVGWIAACAPGPPEGSPASDRVTADQLVLTLALPRDTWRVGEVIEGTATLSVDAGSTTVWGSSGGLIGFEYADAERSSLMVAVSSPDCAEYAIDPATPITSPVWMTGAWVEAPAQQFVADGTARLPEGTWDITAVASFGRSPCSASEDMRATVRVQVVP